MSSDFLEKDIVYVNSANRSLASSATYDFTIDLTQYIRPNIDYDTVTLLNFACPKSYYLITNLNNTFIVTEGAFNTTITIPNGNYSFSTMVGTLTTALQACHWTYSVAASSTTGTYIFSVSGNTGQPIFNFSGNSPYAIIGFNQTSYTFTTNRLASPNIVNFQLTNTIQLMTDMVLRNLLAVIIPDDPDFSTITYSEFAPAYTSQNLQNNYKVSSARFWLLDGNTGQLLNLNGLNFNFTFAIYKKNIYYSKQLENLRLDSDEKLIQSEMSRLEQLEKLHNIKQT